MSYQSFTPDTLKDFDNILPTQKQEYLSKHHQNIIMYPEYFNNLNNCWKNDKYLRDTFILSKIFRICMCQRKKDKNPAQTEAHIADFRNKYLDSLDFSKPSEELLSSCLHHINEIRQVKKDHVRSPEYRKNTEAVCNDMSETFTNLINEKSVAYTATNIIQHVASASEPDDSELRRNTAPHYRVCHFL